MDLENVDQAICLMFNNICNSGVWPRWFKESVSVIIPKPKKTDYTLPKSYRPIALLNTLGKLLTKIIANRLQFDAAAYEVFTLPHAFLRESLGTPGISGTLQGNSRKFPEFLPPKWSPNFGPK